MVELLSPTAISGEMESDWIATSLAVISHYCWASFGIHTISTLTLGPFMAEVIP